MTVLDRIVEGALALASLALLIHFALTVIW